MRTHYVSRDRLGSPVRDAKHKEEDNSQKGIGPRALSRLTGVPYSIVQRATSKANEQKYASMVCEDTPTDEPMEQREQGLKLAC